MCCWPIRQWESNAAERFAALARDRTMRAAIDSPIAIEAVSAAAKAAGTTVGLLVDLDVGLGRTGVQSPAATLPLAQAIDRAPNVRLDGIMIYPGQVWSVPERQEAELKAIDDLVVEAIALWAAHGLAAAIVSGGSTPTAYQSHLIPHLTEIRPGTYVFNDMNTVRGGFCTLDDCAARSAGDGGQRCGRRPGCHRRGLEDADERSNVLHSRTADSGT